MAAFFRLVACVSEMHPHARPGRSPGALIALLATCIALPVPGVGASAISSTQPVSFEAPDDVARPCLSFTQIGDTRLLIPHALVAETAATSSPFDAATPDDGSGTRETARRALNDANAAATLLAARSARHDANGCRIVGSRVGVLIGASEHGLVARWLLAGHVAVRTGDVPVTQLEHRPQHDLPELPSRGVTGGILGTIAPDRTVPVLLMPPILMHHRPDPQH